MIAAQPGRLRAEPDFAEKRRMVGTAGIILFIAATGLLVWRKSLAKKTVWAFLPSGPLFFFLALYLAREQGEGELAEVWVTVPVLFTVFFCLAAGYVNRRLLPQNSPDKLDPLEIALLLLCQPVICLVCYRAFVQ